jgi:hypothetical protein
MANATDGTTDTDIDLEDEFKAASTETDRATKPAALATNVPLFAPAAMVKLAGKLREALPPYKATTAPPAGAGAEIVTTQVVESPLNTLAGLQDKADTLGGADNKIDAVCFEPLAEAVITTVTFALTALAVPVKPALLDPDATVTLAGTPRLEELRERVTARPKAPAGPFRVTVQETLPAPTTVAGLHDKADT